MTSGTTQSPQYWAKVLHNAVQVSPQSPRYAESRQVASYAVQQIDALHGAQNAADSAAVAPGKEMGGVQAVMNGIGLGIPNAISADAQQYADLASKANPGEMAVSGGIGRAFSTIAAGVANPILGFGAAAGVQGMTADPGLTLGPGPRMVAGAVAGGGAAMLGAGEVISTRLAGAILRRFLPTFLPAAKRMTQQFTGLLKGKIPAADIDALAEAHIRAETKRLNPSFSDAQLDQVMGAWRKWNAKVPKGPEVAASPGATVTQIDDPLDVPTYTRRGGRDPRPNMSVLPPETPPPGRTSPTPTPTNGKHVANSYKELQALVRQGIPEDQIQVNYYTRGGKVEQTVPPKPTATVLPKNPFGGKSTDELRGMLLGPNAPRTPMGMRPAIRDEILRRTRAGE